MGFWIYGLVRFPVSGYELSHPGLDGAVMDGIVRVGFEE